MYKKTIFITLKQIVLISSLYLLAACGSGASDNNSQQVPQEQEQEQEIISDYPDYNTSPKSPELSGMEKTALEIASEIQLGWNIGNTMEATGGETAWGNPEISQALIAQVKQSGFDAVRIPIAWDQYANQDTAEISEQWLNRVKQVVQLCVEQDLYVLINIHWDGGWLENNVTKTKQQENIAKQTAFWQQIASHLNDFDQHLLFASANEPEVETEQQMEVLLSYHQAFIDAVRATGGRNAYRVLVVQGPKTDIELTNQLFLQLPSDSQPNRLMAEVHFYSPYNFTLMQEPEDWGNPFYYWGSENHSTDDTAHNPTWGEEAHVLEMFDLMQTQFVDLGIPVILGEFSAMRRIHLTGENLSLHQASRNYYHQFIVEQALKRGLIPFYWDNGSTDNFNSAIFDRNTNQVFDQMTLDALLRGTAQN